MSSPENTRRPDVASLLVIPRLTIPYKGIMDEVSGEYITNPSVFLNKAKRTLSQENPLLRKILAVGVSISPIPEYSEKWALIYYEIFSRSGRKAGLPLSCFVNEKLLEASARTKIQTIIESIGNSSGETLLERFESRLRKARLKDEDMSDELKEFWKTVGEGAEKLKNEGHIEADIKAAKVCLEVFQEILQGNDNQYRLSEQYLNVDPLEGHT